MVHGKINDEDFAENKLNKKEECIAQILYDFRSRIFEFENPHILYDLDDKKLNINKSCRFEYAIFELINIYKNFDWQNYKLVYYGW